MKDIQNIKYYVCPMSRTIADTVLEFSRKAPIFGFIPSRRQIDFNGGYVDSTWNTKTFSEYVGGRIPIIRDHGGPEQGATQDDGIYSFQQDARFLDGVHIDPFIHDADIQKGAEYASNIIRMVSSLNPDMFIEIFTEEAIRRFDTQEMDSFLKNLSTSLSREEFKMIRYCVIQSGTRIDLVNQKNIGEFNENRLSEMISWSKKFNLLTKEHNGDYLSPREIKVRFDAGLDTINIGPEIAQIETEVILNHLSEKDIERWYSICLSSNKWKKWSTDNLDLKNRYQIITVCGHYTRSHAHFPEFTSEIKKAVQLKLDELYELCQ